MKEPTPRTELNPEFETLRAKLAESESKLAEAQEVIRAIQAGDVDAVVLAGPEGEQVFTLQGAEYAYRALVEAMNEGAATLGADGTVLYCNQRLSDLLGAPLERIIGNHVKKNVASVAMHDFDVLLAKAWSGEACKTELEFQTNQGDGIPVYVSLRKMELQAAELCMVVTDLTERKQRDELLAAGRLSTSILESAAEAIAVCDETGKIISANAALENLCGFNPILQAFESALPLELGEEPTGFGKHFSIFDALRSGTLRGQEVRLVRDPVHPISLLLTAAAFKSSAGVVGCVLTMTDITERKRAEEVLRESEARFRSLFENSLDAMFLTSPDGETCAANPASCAMFQMSEEELCRVGRRGVTDPDDPRHAAALENRQRSGKVNTELSYVRKDGTKFTAEVSSVLLGGMPPRSFVVMRDITERKRAEEALLRAEKLASVGRMASTIAHEINNPLEAIGNALYLALTGAEIAEDTKSYLNMAVEELDRVSHITKQTLAFHHQTNTPTPIDLREIIDGSLQIFGPRLRSRRIVIAKRTPQVGKIRGFGGEIQQIISNLLSNSMDAVPNDGRIEFRLSAMNGHGHGHNKVRFTIADTGSGIPPERLAKVFEPFFTTKEMHGTGLGLWVTKQIVEKHGATIRVRSKLGKGTVFSIVFPVSQNVDGQ